MNNVYIYDGTFNSLLNLINILLKNNIRPFDIKNSSYSPNLLENIICLKIDGKNIFDEYLKYLGEDIFKIIYYVFLSAEDKKEIIIYYFLLNYLKYKNKVIYIRNLKCVSEALRISKYVSRENHRFKGFTRFKELKNKVLYAEIEPENNIIKLLSLHFKNRLKNEFWIIKDLKRRILSIYDKNNFYVLNEEDLRLLDIEISDSEDSVEDLWKTFYKNIGIKERKNDKCRMNFMPKKYWKNILEVKEEL